MPVTACEREGPQIAVSTGAQLELAGHLAGHTGQLYRHRDPRVLSAGQVHIADRVTTLL